MCGVDTGVQELVSGNRGVKAVQFLESRCAAKLPVVNSFRDVKEWVLPGYTRAGTRQSCVDLNLLQSRVSLPARFACA
jgi:hypothetical protein